MARPNGECPSCPQCGGTKAVTIHPLHGTNNPACACMECRHIWIDGSKGRNASPVGTPVSVTRIRGSEPWQTASPLKASGTPQPSPEDIGKAVDLTAASPTCGCATEAIVSALFTTSPNPNPVRFVISGMATRQ